MEEDDEPLEDLKPVPDVLSSDEEGQKYTSYTNLDDLD